MVHIVKTIDAHVGGEPLRLLVEGAPRPSGKTMAQKREWMKRHADELRRAVMLEPRGHADMCGALLTDAVSPGSDAGLLFLDGSGFPAMSGHGIIAAATIALERGLIHRAERGGATAEAGGGNEDVRLTFDTPAGTVPARARVEQHVARRRVDRVALTNVPSFVVAGGHPVRVGSREFRVDVAFGGLFYAIVDTEAIGIPLDAPRLPDLRRLGAQIRDALNAAGSIAHHAGAATPGLGQRRGNGAVPPFDGGVDGVVFTGPSRDPEAHLRSVTISGAAAVDWSPSATGMSAVMAVLDAMGLLQDDRPFVEESVIGSLHRGRVLRHTQVGDLAAIVAEIEGSAWLTGEHTFYVDDDDPFREGFSV